ncbi:MAG: hypothetical protein IT576_02080 [Verrucomicrobiales bacterium]|nr:hypothetical protein [Verrucomicrobiales bacterium]
MENTQNLDSERVPISSTPWLDIIGRLAENLIWIAPVGNDDSYRKYYGNGNWTPVPALRGFMVCKRSVNNVDGKNTRVDFLLTDASQRWRWKKPFRECECMFQTMEEAIISAANAAGISLSNAKLSHEEGGKEQR